MGIAVFAELLWSYSVVPAAVLGRLRPGLSAGAGWRLPEVKSPEKKSRQPT